MTPLIVLRPEPEGGERLFLLLGSPGGPRIITSVLQVLLNVVTYGMEIHEAVAAPRFHHQWLPDTLWVEPDGWARDVVNGLEAWGQPVAVRPEPIGSVHSILVDTSGVCRGAPDPRRSGEARGVDRVVRPGR
jgi:gamma-glutamyltranspeptidase/glutathione hydrolase